MITAETLRKWKEALCDVRGHQLGDALVIAEVCAEIETEADKLKERKFYPCGCSRLKVQAGRCDIYGPDGKER